MTVESTWTERVGQTPSAVFSVGSEAVVAAATMSPSVRLRFPPSDWFCSPETASGLRGAPGPRSLPVAAGLVAAASGSLDYSVLRLRSGSSGGVSPAVGVLRGGLACGGGPQGGSSPRGGKRRTAGFFSLIQKTADNHKRGRLWWIY